MLFILVTLVVPNVDKSREVNDEQLKNILSILVTFGLLKFERFKWHNDEHP